MGLDHCEASTYHLWVLELEFPIRPNDYVLTANADFLVNLITDGEPKVLTRLIASMGSHAWATGYLGHGVQRCR